MKYSYYLIPLLLLITTLQAEVTSRQMQFPFGAWLHEGDWDMLCPNEGYLTGVADLIENIDGKDHVVAWALCTRTPYDDRVQLKLDIENKGIVFARKFHQANQKFVAHSRQIGGNNINELRLAQYNHPFNQYEHQCSEGSFITGIETFGKARKVFGTPIATRKGLRLLCSKFTNGDATEQSSVVVSDRDASWGGSNFGKLRCPEGQAAIGIGQRWDSSTSSRLEMVLHCQPVE